MTICMSKIINRTDGPPGFDTKYNLKLVLQVCQHEELAKVSVLGWLIAKKIDR